MNMSLHIVFLLLGIIVNYVFLVMNLLLVVNISKTCKFVIRSITQHYDQLLATVLLSFIIVYLYTIILAESLYDTLAVENGDSLQICKTLPSCFLYSVSNGFRLDGIITLVSKTEVRGERFYWRALFDLTLNLLVKVVCSNIIFGIIIDTFGALRDEQAARGTIFLSPSRTGSDLQLLCVREPEIRLLQDVSQLRGAQGTPPQRMELHLLPLLPKQKGRGRAHGS